MEDERATPAEFGLGPEPDASVKAEVVSVPSKRKASGGKFKASLLLWAN